MPRIRYIKPEFFSDEDLAELPFETRITYAGLWCYADRAGRMEDRPKFLKAMIFPYDKVDIEKQLELLSKPKATNRTPFIFRYEVESHRYIEILHWEKHQKPHHTEADSKFPPAPPFKGNGKGNGDGECHEDIPELNNGEITVKTPLKISDQEFISALKENPAFKGIDLDLQLCKMDAWLLTKPGRQKTRKFIINWLNKIDRPMDSSGALGHCFLNEKGIWECRQCGKVFSLKENMEKHRHEDGKN